MSKERQRQAFIETALHYQGRLYQWGADGPLTFDCSGLAMECGKAGGLFPDRMDMTSAGIYLYCREKDWGRTGQDITFESGFVFWSRTDKPSQIHHVAVIIAPGLCVEAGGGGSRTKTDADAIRHHAYVRQRPIGRVTERLESWDNKMRTLYWANPFKG